MSAVATSDLVVRFGALTAVDGVSLSIEPGEVFGLLGPNGAGKTTTLRVLTTLLRADAGSASVAGWDVRGESLEVRASIGYVPQALSADGGLTARENLDFYARVTSVPRSERASRIAAAVEAMELEPMLDRMARTFSGGMLRRLEIATALLNQPSVLFLDEPTVGLDPTARALVWERVHALRAEHGTTVVVTTHLMEEAERHCDRVAIMDGGRIVALGTVGELLADCGVRSLEDVFRAVTGHLIADEGRYSDVRAQRRVARRLSGESRRPRPAALAGGPLRRLFAGALAMSLTEWRKLRHDQLDLITRSVQPLLWLFVFGTAMSSLHAIPTGGIEYRAYLAPGVMAQAAMFVAIFFGLAVIWERDVGQLQRLLATPLPRSALVIGKSAGAATRAVIQAIVLMVVVAIAGIALKWSVVGVLGALVLLAIGTGAFACLSMTIASLVKERERFMGIGQLVMMPLFFASSALYPLAIMPGWLRAVAHVNPLTYEVEGLRGFLLGGGHPWVDMLVCTGWFAVLAAAATRAYPRAIL